MLLSLSLFKIINCTNLWQLWETNCTLLFPTYINTWMNEWRNETIRYNNNNNKTNGYYLVMLTDLKKSSYLYSWARAYLSFANQQPRIRLSEWARARAHTHNQIQWVSEWVS